MIDGVRYAVPGDMASVDADGSIAIYGRGSVSINSGGEKIYPEEVEKALKHHPAVFDATVVGTPHERFGSQVTAVVELRPSARETPPSLADLRDHCAEHLAGLQGAPCRRVRRRDGAIAVGQARLPLGPGHRPRRARGLDRILSGTPSLAELGIGSGRQARPTGLTDRPGRQVGPGWTLASLSRVEAPAGHARQRPDVIGLASVNVGTPTVLAEGDGTTVWSGIRKSPVRPDSDPLALGVNLAGDGQADLSVHGGPDKAVYAYPSEHLGSVERRSWRRRWGPAPFGENLTTIGVPRPTCCIGDVWSWGDGHAPGVPAPLAVLQARPPPGPRRHPAAHAPQRAHRLVPPRARAGRGEHRERDPRRAPATRPALTVTDAHLAMGDRHLLQPDLVRAAGRPRPPRRPVARAAAPAARRLTEDH